MNPLGVVFSARNFKPCLEWIDRIQSIDKLYLVNYTLDDALPMAREYFLHHPEYTHFLHIPEDCIISNVMVNLVIDDVEKHGFKIIGGWCNYTWIKDWVTFTFKDMSRIIPLSAEMFNLVRKDDILRLQYGYPFVKVYHAGWILQLVDREVIEKIPFRALRYLTTRIDGIVWKWGASHDLAFSIDANKQGYDIMVDLRVGILHFGNTSHFLTFKNKNRYVKLITKNNEEKIIREDKPYY